MVKKKRKRKPKSLKTRLIPVIRNVHRFWEGKKEAKNAAKVKVEIGKFKNGNPKFKNHFKCASCEQLFLEEDVQVDHIDPVIDIDLGWQGWDVFIERMFVSADKYQILCKPCHDIKSEFEKEYRKDKKKLDK